MGEGLISRSDLLRKEESCLQSSPLISTRTYARTHALTDVLLLVWAEKGKVGLREGSATVIATNN